MTDDNIKEVINRTSIVDIINSTIPLKKKGNNYFGLSPFKKEKTPSFSVNEEKKIFHCFSTGEHGNVIDFLIKVKGYDFKDALNELASKAGVELSYKSSKINSTIYEINQFTKELFHSNLLQSKICMDYLIDKRKFTYFWHLSWSPAFSVSIRRKNRKNEIWTSWCKSSSTRY